MTQSTDIAKTSTRQRIVEMADQLFYARGYDHTSFADIADAVSLSRGNFYYHFKTKDEILAAVIELRVNRTRALLHHWSAEAGTPVERITRFIDMLVMNRGNIRKHGCPVGTLCTELAKLEHPALMQANLLFGLFRDWLAEQLTQANVSGDTRALAMHLLARSQGIATLANAFDDEAFIHQEVTQLQHWLHALTGSSPAQPPQNRAYTPGQ
jgi:AcrR family transcriptional regulator